ncbi:cytochrome P450 71AU50-like [Magnolia sinica]|uniref:cytochrome P450 71AU50-like n=1 Tax=Magnolia sinica TaxID=86752 RepID=UPI002658DD75|nr:cytochrome P450 71AU50-like [Magnolia sinica]
MSWTAFLFLVLGFLWLAYVLHHHVGRKGKKPKNKLPPGPPGLPILGNLLMLGELPHHDLHKLSKEHGPIMYLQFGFVPTIVVSSPQAAQQFLKTHDLVFASRPVTEAAKYMSYERKGLSFNEYGPYWRSLRKLCTLKLLSNVKIDHFKLMRREELGLLVRSIKDSAQARDAVDLSAKLSSLTTNMTCLMVFGKKYMDEDLDERGFHGVIGEGMKLGAAFNVADYIPYVGALDLQGLTRRMKAFAKVMDAFFENVIDEHVRTRDKAHQRDFVDVMLSFMESNDAELQIDRNNIKAIILDMLAAGMDTSATAIEWALSDLFKHPPVMKKVQEELERVVGQDRMVEESDLSKLEYLDMVIKESMRLHPVAPLLIPHEAMEDCTVNGYHIPKKSRVIINVWAIGRDTDAWPDPEQFSPERFIASNVDVRGRDFQLLPFGSGRRGCPGLQLGLTMVRLVLAQLLHCFDWELPNGVSPEDLDMTEKFSLVVPRAHHLLAIPTYRIRDDIL